MTSPNEDQVQHRHYAVRLDKIETRKLRAETWVGEEVPDWVKTFDDSFGVSVRSTGEALVTVVLEVAVGGDDHPRAVLAEVAAVYELADLTDLSETDGPEVALIHDTDAFLKSAPDTTRRWLTNTAIHDLTPYIREIVSSLSMRLDPQNPIVIGGVPFMDEDEEAEDDQDRADGV